MPGSSPKAISLRIIQRQRKLYPVEMGTQRKGATLDCIPVEILILLPGRTTVAVYGERVARRRRRCFPAEIRTDEASILRE
jgi:hypothetical protein